MGFFDKVKGAFTNGHGPNGNGISTAGNVALTAATGGLWAPVWGAQAAGKAIKNREYSPVKDAKDQYQKDVAALQDPQKLGLTDAERQKMISEATQQASAQQNAQTSQLNQMALGGQGFQAGTFADAARGVAQQTNDATAKAAVGVNQLNQQIIDNEKQRILSEMDAARERAKENTRFWLQFGITSVGQLIGAAIGNPLVGAAGAAAPAPAPAPAAT